MLPHYNNVNGCRYINDSLHGYCPICLSENIGQYSVEPYWDESNPYGKTYVEYHFKCNDCDWKGNSHRDYLCCIRYDYEKLFIEKYKNNKEVLENFIKTSHYNKDYFKQPEPIKSMQNLKEVKKIGNNMLISFLDKSYIRIPFYKMLNISIDIKGRLNITFSSHDNGDFITMEFYDVKGDIYKNMCSEFNYESNIPK